MGDAGSMVLGMALAWFTVELSQGEQRILSPVVAVWIVGLPLLDTVTVMIRRGLNGKSPFQADRGHLHHILLMSGFSDAKAVYIMLSISALFGGIGVAGWYLQIPEPVLLYSFMGLFTLYFFGSAHALRGLRRGDCADSLPEAGGG
jgi:UDP-GlcNAc:undecaprenyl-phosphate GlcNAc-1-phosphate transferase